MKISTAITMTDGPPEIPNDLTDRQQALVDGAVLTVWVVLTAAVTGAVAILLGWPLWTAGILPAVCVAYATVQTARRQS